MAYKTCYFKNTSGSTDTWCGQQLDNNQEYQIQDSERVVWASDDKVLTDIGNGDGAIGNGSSYFSTVNEQINYLKDEVPREAIIEYTYAYSMMADAISQTVTAGEATNVDYKVVNQSGESYSYKYLYGGTAFTTNAEWGDWAEFQIVDKEGVYYPAGTVLKKYVIKQYVNPNHPIKSYAQSPGKIPVNVYLRCIYHSVGETNPTVFINYDIQNKD